MASSIPPPTPPHPSDSPRPPHSDPPPAPGGIQRQSIPNLLTIGRLGLAIALFGMLTPWNINQSGAVRSGGPDSWLLGAAALFIVAALTDALDGYLARKWNAVSVFGRIMDPFADKLLVIGAFVLLAGPGFWRIDATGDGVQVSGVLPWMVVVIAFPATASGKWKMILQSVSVPAIMVLVAFGPEGWRLTAIIALAWVTVVVTAWSGVPYVLRAMRELRSPPAPAPPVG
jgi:CDP-diacylglycerol---glycerol-3-phosphate 3-phosphatidyltransferase